MWNFKATYQLRENGSFFSENIDSDEIDFVDAVADAVRRLERDNVEIHNISIEKI